MAELIITDAQGVDRESVADYKLDSAWGSDENDFELTVSGRLIESGSYVYLDGGECGGVVDALKDSLKRGESTLTYPAAHGTACWLIRFSPPTQARII